MKKILSSMVPLSVLVFISSCGEGGKGHVVTENRQVKPFHKISIEGTFPVKISQTGAPESVKVQADENLQDIIEVHNDGDWLYINFKKNPPSAGLKK